MLYLYFAGFLSPTTNVPGPSLPESSNVTHSSSDRGDDSDIIGPALPPNLRTNRAENSAIIGPALPSAAGSDRDIGPRLPSERIDQIGPVLPTDFIAATESARSEHETSVIGPCLPAGMRGVGGGGESDSDDDYVGPRPSEMASGDTSRVTEAEFEQRAQRMRDKMEGKVRER